MNDCDSGDGESYFKNFQIIDLDDDVIDVASVTWSAWDSSQDYTGTQNIFETENTVQLEQNAWRGFHLPSDVTVTATNLLSFRFKSSNLCEIHAVTLSDSNSDHTDDTNIKLCGSQSVDGSAHWDSVPESDVCDDSGEVMRYRNHITTNTYTFN